MRSLQILACGGRLGKLPALEAAQLPGCSSSWGAEALAQSRVSGSINTVFFPQREPSSHFHKRHNILPCNTHVFC